MNNKDLLSMGFYNLWRRKTRTFLTVLGVIIGTSSIVVMLSLGIAMDRSFKENLANMGSLNVIEVNSARYYRDDMGSRNQEEGKLDDTAVAKFKKISGVEAVMPIKRTYMKIAVGRMVAGVSVIGIDPEVMEPFDFKIEKGRLLSANDKDALVFGKNVAWDFYNPRSRNPSYGGDRMGEPNVNLISNRLILTSDMEYGERRANTGERDPDDKPPKPHNVKGVGILQESNSEKDYNAYMNITALEKIMKEDEKSRRDDGSKRRAREEDPYQNIKVKVQDIQQVEQVQEQIKVMGFQTFSLTDMLKSMKETSRKIQAILGGIGAVSLLVAAIGITNTMIMSIYERTREIGVMKVLGANLVDIKKLFLLEAGMIGFCGGILGLILSYFVSFGLNKIGAGMMEPSQSATGISVITLGLAVSAVIFATVVGIISGYSPARRAMNLSALEAIKTE
ncbi:ABC transporter permease [Clostridiaceae bacterium 35-E11]